MTNETNPLGDMSKMSQQPHVPGLDLDAIMQSSAKDMEALTAPHQSTSEALQALARKQTEILTETMQGIQDAAKGLASAGVGAPNAAKQADLVGNAYQKALADMKELAEMVRKSQTDAMAGITARAAESLQEMKKLMQPK